jgi:hypothetical protein
VHLERARDQRRCSDLAWILDRTGRESVLAGTTGMSSGVDVLVGRLGRMHGHHGPQRVWLPCLSPTLVTVCDEPIAEVARASSVALSWLTSYAVRVNCPDTARGVRTVRLGPPTRTIRTRSGRPVHAPFAHRVRTSCSAPCSRGLQASELLTLVQTICKRTTRSSAAQGGARRHEARTGRHETAPDGTDGTSPPDS